MANAEPVLVPSWCELPPNAPASSALNGPMLGVKTDGVTEPCRLERPAPNCESANEPSSEAAGQSSRNAGAIDVPVARMLSAYQTPVPVRSMLDFTRCADRLAALILIVATMARALHCTRYVPTLRIELSVSKSSARVGAYGSATQRFPSTMNAYS